MRPIESYLSKKHEELSKTYQASGANHSNHCMTVAIQSALLLALEGKEPYIVSFSTKNPETEDLVPEQYKGRLKWSKHFAACEGEVAYDPLIGRPVALKDYAKIAFGCDAEMKVYLSREDLKKVFGEAKDKK